MARLRAHQSTPDGVRAAYSMAEVASRLGLSQAHVEDCAREGLLPSFKVGRRRLVPAAAIEALLAQAMATSPCGVMPATEPEAGKPK